MRIRNLFIIAIDFICKKRREYIFSIIVCTFMCYFIDTYMLDYDNILYTQSAISSCFSVNINNIYNIKYKDYLNDNYYKFCQELYSVEEFDLFGTFDKSTTLFWEKGVDYSEYFYIKEDDEYIDYFNSDFMDVFGSCIELLNIVDSNGDKLTGQYNKDKDLNDIYNNRKNISGSELENATPIYIGYKYKDSMPIGTVLKEGYTDEQIDGDTNLDEVEFKYKTYVVAGFLAEDQYFLKTNNLENEEGILNNLDRTVICVKDSLETTNSSNFYFTSGNSEKAILEVKGLASKYGIHVEIKSVSDELRDMKKKQIENFKYYGIMFGIMICNSFIFVTFASLMILMIKKNEIGILYANGVTHKNMSAIIFIINIICTVVSGMIGFTIRTLRLNSLYLQYEEITRLEKIQYIRKYYVSWQIMMFCVILSVISSIISAKVINRYSIRELIGNNE